jgi:Cu/Ag efflux protein CusF
MNRACRLLIAAALAWGVAAMAQDKPMPAAVGAASVSVTATVEAIDHANRIVTLRGQNGEVTVFKVGPEVQNLAQVKKGDVVSAEYVRAIAMELKKGGGLRSSTEQAGAARTPPGAMPGAAVTNTAVIVADVVRVDAANRQIAVKGPKGNVVELAVKDPAVLAQFKAGDQVEAVITEALVLSVKHPAAKK